MAQANTTLPPTVCIPVRLNPMIDLAFRSVGGHGRVGGDEIGWRSVIAREAEGEVEGVI